MARSMFMLLFECSKAGSSAPFTRIHVRVMCTVLGSCRAWTKQIQWTWAGQAMGWLRYNHSFPARQSAMFLSIKEMELRKLRFDEAFEPGDIDFSGADVQQSNALKVQGAAELLAHTGGEIRIRGRLQVQMESACDRCLSRATFPLESSFDLFYRPNSSLTREEEVAIDEGESEIGFYEGGGLELEDILREQVLLLLPMQRVCASDCKGICPVCGKNRNETECD